MIASPSRRNLRRLVLVGGVTLSFILASCASHLRIQSDELTAGSLRLAQVMQFASRNEIREIKVLYDVIQASGVNDSDIVDGSVALARIYCCGGLTENISFEKADAMMLYVPKGVIVTPGDIVEVRVGRPPEMGDAGLLNIVTRVVERVRADGAACWWDPKNDRNMWLRVLYCEWMPQEGWIKQDGASPAWFKPPAAGLSRK